MHEQSGWTDGWMNRGTHLMVWWYSMICMFLLLLLFFLPLLVQSVRIALCSEIQHTGKS